MLRSRMGFGALAVLIAGFSIIASLLPVVKADAVAVPGPGGTGPVITFIDAGHIALDAQGTYADSQGQKLDISPATGMYFDGKSVDDGQDWPLTQVGSNPEFWFDGQQSKTCPNGNDSFLAINKGTYQPGNGTTTATLHLVVPETGTNTPNQCGNVTINDVPVGDLSVGGTMATMKEAAERGGIEAHTGINVAAAASTTLFFEASATRIIEAGDDPAYQGNGHGKYVFSVPASGSANFVQDNTAAGVSAKCPDYITLGNTTGEYVVATLYTYEEAQNCGNTPTDHFQILVLTTTPQSMLGQLTTGGGGAPPGTGGTAAPPDNCPIQNWALRWLVCPVIDAIDDAVAPLDGYLDNLLTIPDNTFDTTQNPGKAYFQAWGDFRDIAVSLLVIVALVMVIGQSAGFDLLDAYSIRKILPRLLVGAIGLTLSWVIVAFVVQFFNNLGNWTGDILLSPFQGLYNNGAALTPTGVLGTIENAGGATLFAGATITAATALIVTLGIPAILTLILTLFLAMIVAFVTLTIRTMIIILTIITAPVAVVAYILPTTQRIWKFWRDALLDALVVFPIVAAFLAVGRILAILSITSKGLVPILAPVAIIVSYMSIGKAFTAAGGLIGLAAGAVHGAHGGAFGTLKKYRRAKPAQRFHAAKEGKLYSGTNAVGRRLNPIVQGIALSPQALSQSPLSPRSWRSNVAGLAGRAEHNDASEIMEKDEAFKDIKGDDMKLWAIMETTGAGGAFARQNIDARLTDNADGVRQSLINHGFVGSDAEREIVVSQIMAAKKSGGNGTGLLQAATRAQASTGTGYGTDLNTGQASEDGAGQMMQWIDTAAGENTNAAGNMVAEMRGAAMQSGRVDLGGAGFGDTMRAYNQVHRARLGMSPVNEDGDVVAGPALTPQMAVDRANTTILDSAIDGNGSAQAAHGKPRSAAAVGRQHARRMSELLQQVDVAYAGQGTTHTADQLDAARRGADHELAAIMGLYDVMGHESPLNQRELANALTGLGVVDASGLRDSPTNGMTILDLGQMRTGESHHFQEARRDYGTGTAAASAGAPGGGGAPPAPGAPGAGAPGG